MNVIEKDYTITENGNHDIPLILPDGRQAVSANIDARGTWDGLNLDFTVAVNTTFDDPLEGAISTISSDSFVNLLSILTTKAAYRTLRMAASSAGTTSVVVKILVTYR